MTVSCDCFYLGQHGPSAPKPTAPPPSPSGTDSSRALELAERSPWIDVHAHPGRCFLAGLPSEDLYVRLLGADTPEEARADQRAGRVAVSCFATVSDLRVLSANDDGLFAARDFEPGEAYADHRRQIDSLRALWEHDDVQAVRNADDIESAHRAGRQGILITCEGADFLEGDLSRVEEAFELGVRSITLVHYRVNELGDIQTEAPVHQGLSPFGRDVVREMNRLGMIVDLAHATFAVAQDALEVSTAPVMISHSHLAAGPDSHPRLLSGEHASAVADAGGLIGAWPAGVAARNFEEYVDEILRLIDRVGVHHVAIGTDLDANYQPVLTRYAEFPTLAETLLERGLDADDLGLVLGGNFLRLLRSVAG